MGPASTACRGAHHATTAPACRPCHPRHGSAAAAARAPAGAGPGAVGAGDSRAQPRLVGDTCRLTERMLDRREDVVDVKAQRGKYHQDEPGDEREEQARLDESLDEHRKDVVLGTRIVVVHERCAFLSVQMCAIASQNVSVCLPLWDCTGSTLPRG